MLSARRVCGALALGGGHHCLMVSRCGLISMNEPVSNACCTRDHALALDEVFTRKAAVLIEHHGLGRLGCVAGTRELVAQRNCVLIYDVADHLVRVLRALHVARQWPPQE